jgi:hypothetical protein
MPWKKVVNYRLGYSYPKRSFYFYYELRARAWFTNSFRPPRSSSA